MLIQKTKINAPYTYLKWEWQAKRISCLTPNLWCLHRKRKDKSPHQSDQFMPAIFFLKIKHGNIWSKWNRRLVYFCISLCLCTCVYVHHLECVWTHVYTCVSAWACVYMCVCVCVLESHLDWLRHLLHHTSGAWCDIWGIYCILPCNITHNLLLKVIMYPLIHF